MNCAHKGFHTVRSRYDRRREVLIFFWTCEHCGEKLGEAARESYTPRFDRLGNERHLGTAS
jgi:hypothetical protein